MSVRIQCPHCGILCQVGEDLFGLQVNCGRCNQPFTVSGGSSVAPPAAPAKSTTPSEGFRGVMKSLMPFSKVDEIPEAEAPDDDLSFDFVPEATSRMGGAVAPSPPPPSPPAATESWSGPRATGVCRLDVGGATSVGMVRQRNEDSFLVQQFSWSNLDQRREIALVVVADGMGGHEAGEKASQMVIQGVGSALASLLGGALFGQGKDMTPTTLARAVESAIKSANQAIHRRGQSEPGCKGMGSTAAVVLIWDGQALIGHVGDCRVYGCRGGKLNQLTRDQTLVERLVKLGQLRPEEAARHPARNEVAQAIGRQPDVEPASSQLKLIVGDWLIVACDGLHAHVDASKLENAIRQSPPSASWLAHHLVELANEGGGSDNCTVVAIRCY